VIQNNPKHQHDMSNGTFDMNHTLAFEWQALGEQGRSAWVEQMDQEAKSLDAEKQVIASSGTSRQGAADVDLPLVAPGDQDVEMADDVESHSGGDAGGFTAVNRP
jgi:hypothetical protein